MRCWPQEARWRWRPATPADAACWQALPAPAGQADSHLEQPGDGADDALLQRQRHRASEGRARWSSTKGRKLGLDSWLGQPASAAPDRGGLRPVVLRQATGAGCPPPRLIHRAGARSRRPQAVDPGWSAATGRPAAEGLDLRRRAICSSPWPVASSTSSSSAPGGWWPG